MTKEQFEKEKSSIDNKYNGKIFYDFDSFDQIKIVGEGIRSSRRFERNEKKSNKALEVIKHLKNKKYNTPLTFDESLIYIGAHIGMGIVAGIVPEITSETPELSQMAINAGIGACLGNVAAKANLLGYHTQPIEKFIDRLNLKYQTRKYLNATNKRNLDVYRLSKIVDIVKMRKPSEMANEDLFVSEPILTLNADEFELDK